MLATWAPERARSRKRDVPTNSPVVAYHADCVRFGLLPDGVVSGLGRFETHDEVITDVVGNFVEEGYAHVGILVLESGDIIGVVGGFCEEWQCETASLVGGLVKLAWACVFCLEACNRRAGLDILTLMFILKVAARRILACGGTGCTVQDSKEKRYVVS